MFSRVQLVQLMFLDLCKGAHDHFDTVLSASKPTCLSQRRCLSQILPLKRPRSHILTALNWHGDCHWYLTPSARSC
jgi:hypothetical protein